MTKSQETILAQNANLKLIQTWMLRTPDDYLTAKTRPQMMHMFAALGQGCFFPSPFVVMSMCRDGKTLIGLQDPNDYWVFFMR
jgi:hypothetical protein